MNEPEMIIIYKDGSSVSYPLDDMSDSDYESYLMYNLDFVREIHIFFDEGDP